MQSLAWRVHRLDLFKQRKGQRLRESEKGKPLRTYPSKKTRGKIGQHRSSPTGHQVSLKNTSPPLRAVAARRSQRNVRVNWGLEALPGYQDDLAPPEMQDGCLHSDRTVGRGRGAFRTMTPKHTGQEAYFVQGVVVKKVRAMSMYECTPMSFVEAVSAIADTEPRLLYYSQGETVSPARREVLNVDFRVRSGLALTPKEKSWRMSNMFNEAPVPDRRLGQDDVYHLLRLTPLHCRRADHQ